MRSSPFRTFEGAQAQASLAATLLALGRNEDASAAFARAVTLSPADLGLRSNLGIALQKSGRTEEAKKVFAEVERIRASRLKDESAN